MKYNYVYSQDVLMIFGDFGREESCPYRVDAAFVTWWRSAGQPSMI